MKKKSPVKVILTKYTAKLGEVGDQINVASGYARNFLFPTKSAVPANEYWTSHFKHKKREFIKNESIRLELAQELRDKLVDFSLTLTAPASRAGSLYGSIGAKEIMHALKEQDIIVEASEVFIPNKSIREIGQSIVTLQPHPSISVDIQVDVSVAS